MAETYTIQNAFDDREKKRKGQQYGDAYEAWRTDPSTANMRRVVEELKNPIESAVGHYLGQNASPALRHRARLIAAQAVKSYDPSRGASLATHVNQNLRALQRVAPQVVDPLSPSEHFRRHQMEINRASTELQEALGREPTDEEIADLTSLPLRRVSRVRSRMRARIPLSTYEMTDDDSDDAPDIVGGERTDYDDWVDAVYTDLGEIDRLIMMYRTGYRNSDILSNQEIASRLNISPAAVSQRAKRIQRRLDDFYAAAPRR